ncbi:MAG: MOSC domain-containing protein [Thermoflexibacter sp.]
MKTIEQLIQCLPQIGQVTWVSIRPERGGQVKVLEEVEVVENKGLAGDHYKGKVDSKRHVTLIQAEHLQAVASMLGRESIDPALTRRNIVVKGINLLALQNKQFQIGEAILETTGLCYPCSRMEENLGEGGYNAMRGHGGITARIVKGGKVRIGDEVKVI